MKRTISLTAVLLSALLFLAAPLMASETLTGDEIVTRANNAAYYAGNDGRSNVTMTITDSQKRTRNNEFAILRRDSADGGDQQFYVYFERPSDIRKMAFMVHKHIDRDDDRWLYLPSLDLVKRIAASDKRTSFVGSNFFYEDVSGRGLDEDVHELIETTDSQYVVKNTPKDLASVEFSSYTVRIDRKTFMPVYAEYLDKNGVKYREVEALTIENIDGHPTVTKSRVRDLASGGETVSEFKDIKYDIGLKEDIFTERYLRRPPREVRSRR
ncbi:MAG: outer membrane lipoprotein-sorting protein [Desulfobulbaceae bacterium]|nr:outer membrane lipoprotein-sorting protein [Desulfobulbaceae bacterium]